MGAREQSLERLARECRLEFTRASGPGGQRRNKAETAVRVVHVPTGLRAQASERRSQAQNRAEALRRLAAKLAARAKRRKHRVPTRKPGTLRKKELDEKRRAAAKKRGRRVPDSEE